MININGIIQEKKSIDIEINKKNNFLHAINLKKIDKSFLCHQLFFVFLNLSYLIFNLLTLENESSYLTISFLLSALIYYIIESYQAGDLFELQDKIIKEYGNKNFFKMRKFSKRLYMSIYVIFAVTTFFCALLGIDINIILTVMSLMVAISVIRFFLFYDFIIKKFIKRKSIQKDLKNSLKDLEERKKSLMIKEFNLTEDKKLMSEIYSNIENNKYNEREMDYISDLVSSFKIRKKNELDLQIKKENLKSKIKHTYGEDFKTIDNINKELLKVENN